MLEDCYMYKIYILINDIAWYYFDYVNFSFVTLIHNKNIYTEL